MRGSLVLERVVLLSLAAGFVLLSLPQEAFASSESPNGSQESWLARFFQFTWIKEENLPVLVGTLVSTAAVLFFIFIARRGKQLYIRPIPGLHAVEEAVGRATEMGKPILYCSGVADIRCPGVLASMTMLGWVAEMVARYGASLTFPVNQPINLPIGQEAVRSGYYRAGRPEAYRDDMVFFISGLQFAFAAAVCGIMERERPAANFFFGSFWSEALILTETGSVCGALQIAATDMVDQLPFMVATCDYVIIGEELYAASAYLGEDPEFVGGLKGQDLIKAFILLLLLGGLILNSLKIWFPAHFEGIYGEFLNILSK